MRWGAAWLMPLVLLPGCDSGAAPDSTVNQSVSTGRRVSSGLLAEAAGERVSSGDTSGHSAPWSHARVVGDRTLLLWSTYCDSPDGAAAVLSGDLVAVSVYWPAPHGVTGGRPGKSCPPEATMRRIELPEPIGGRLVVDGAVGSRRLVGWKRADLIFDDRTVRLQIDDPLCGSIPLVHVVETETEVIITADVDPDAVPVPHRSCATDPFMSEFKLLSPLGSREIIDGACRLEAGADRCGRVS